MKVFSVSVEFHKAGSLDVASFKVLAPSPGEALKAVISSNGGVFDSANFLEARVSELNEPVILETELEGRIPCRFK